MLKIYKYFFNPRSSSNRDPKVTTGWWIRMRTKMTSSHGHSTVYTVYSSTLQPVRMAQVRGYNIDSKTHNHTHQQGCRQTSLWQMQRLVWTSLIGHNHAGIHSTGTGIYSNSSQRFGKLIDQEKSVRCKYMAQVSNSNILTNKRFAVISGGAT